MFRANVIDNHRGDGNLETKLSHGCSYRIIVCQLIGKSGKSSNSTQRLRAQRQRRAEAGLGEPEP